MRFASLFLVFQCLSVLTLVAPVSNSGVQALTRGLDYSRSLVQQSQPMRGEGKKNEVGEAGEQVSLHQKREDKIWRTRIKLELPDQQGNVREHELSLGTTDSEKGVLRVRAGPYVGHIVYAVDLFEVEQFKRTHFHPGHTTVLAEGAFRNKVGVTHQYIVSSACDPKSPYITLELELPTPNEKEHLKKKYILTLTRIADECGVQRHKIENDDYIDHIVYAVDPQKAADFKFLQFYPGGPTVLGEKDVVSRAGIVVQYIVSSARVDGPPKSERTVCWRTRITFKLPDEQGNLKEEWLFLAPTDPEKGVLRVRSGPYVGHVVYAVDPSKVKEYKQTHFHSEGPTVLFEGVFPNKAGVNHQYIVSSATVGPLKKYTVLSMKTIITLYFPTSDWKRKPCHLYLQPIDDPEDGVQCYEVSQPEYNHHIVYAVDLSKVKKFRDSHFHPDAPEQLLGEGISENKEQTHHHYFLSSRLYDKNADRRIMSR